MTTLPTSLQGLPRLDHIRHHELLHTFYNTYNNALAQFVTFEQFGAVGDGTTDDTAAVQAAFDYAVGTVSTLAKTIIADDKTYKITSTITVNDTRGLVVVGKGYKTKFVWGGSDLGVMFKLTNTQHCVFSNFVVIANSVSKRLKNAFWMFTSSASHTYVSRFNRFEHMEIDGKVSYVQTPFRIGGDTSTEGVSDANNDFHSFDHVTVTNYSGIGWSLENSQIYNVEFRNCIFTPSSSGLYGVSSGSGTGGQGGNFHWYGGGGGGCSVADFYIGAFNNASVIIKGFDSEDSSRLLETTGPAGNYKNVTIEGCSWRSSGLNADGYVVLFKYPGLLTIRDSFIGNETAKALRFGFQSGFTDPYVLTLSNNIIKSSLAAGSLFVAGSPTLTGNIRVDGTGNYALP